MSETLKRLIYFLAFIEGGAVMCVELCSAKILSPYFGTSIYVWASVLGITLTALMSGYYLGGYISSKNQKKEVIFWLMLISGFLVALIPIISSSILPSTINLSLLTGTVVSLMCFLFVPLLLFGAVSPLVINLLTDEAKDSGKSSGTVYAVSTLGGILTTFVVGFYTLPQWGISITLYSYGMLVVLVSMLLFFASQTFKVSVGVLVVATLFSYGFQDKDDGLGVIYRTEGILGEVKVVDRNYFKDNQQKPYRELMVNNITQTMMDLGNPNKSYWDYVSVLTYNLSAYSDGTKGKKTLLLGLGGGTLYKQLERYQLDIDVVEIDERIEQIAKEYFYINQDVNVVIDDARHYIRTTDKKYDIIIYDLYHSETPPVHIMTQEAFGEIKSRLNKNGILAVNFYGFITGDEGTAARSIYKTLKDQNYKISLVATSGQEQHRNLLFICSQEELKSNNNIIHTIIEEKDINFDDAIVLVDDQPILEHLYLKAALAWRKSYNEQNAKYFLKNK